MSTMGAEQHTVEVVLLLLLFVALLALLARRLAVPYPLVMVVGGLVLSLAPFIPRIELAPDLVFLLFLPPLLFSAAYFTSVRELWRQVRPVSLLAFGLVLTTTVAVAVVAHGLAPALGWAGAFTLGAIVSPPDAIAATSIAQRLGLPRRLVTIIEGESLVNDATALVAYRLAVVAAVTGTFSIGEAALSFVVVAAGGALIGLAFGLLLVWLLDLLHDPPVEVLLSLLAPFGAYLAAELIGASGVLSTVVAGLLVGWRSPRIMSSDTRVLGSSTWQIVVFAVNGLAFILIGLELPAIVERLEGRSILPYVTVGLLVTLTVVAVRILWVFPGAYLPRRLIPRIRRRERDPDRRAVLIVGWAGMRGVVSLAAALAVPLSVGDGSPFPGRDLILFTTFTVVLLTLLGHGLTLPALIRWSGVGDDGSTQHEELHAREAATAAALQRLDGLWDEWPGHRELIDALRGRFEHQTEHLAHDHETGEPATDQEEVEHRAIRHAVIEAQREAVILLRDRGVITDQALRRVERDLDLEELRMEA